VNVFFIQEKVHKGDSCKTHLHLATAPAPCIDIRKPIFRICCHKPVRGYAAVTVCPGYDSRDPCVKKVPAPVCIRFPISDGHTVHHVFFLKIRCPAVLHFPDPSFFCLFGSIFSSFFCDFPQFGNPHAKCRHPGCV